MKYILLLRKNIKKQKGVFCGMLILVFIITMALCAVLTIGENSKVYEREQLDRVGYGDVTSWLMEQPGLDELIRQIQGMSGTDKISRQKIRSAPYKVGGKLNENGGWLAVYEPENYNYYIYNENLTGIQKNAKELKEGEMYVPPSFSTLYGVKIGDQVEIQIAGEKKTESFTIKGFFEDPFMGSAMMGMKTMLISRTSMEKIGQEALAAGEASTVIDGEMLHIYQKPDDGQTTNEFLMELNENTDIRQYTYGTYQKSAIEGFMLIAQNIFVGFFLVFVAVLVVVAVLVLSHNITTGIEQDYTNMGVLKALGFTNRDLQWIKMYQYLLSVVIGMALGIPAAVPVVRFINHLIIPATGLLIPVTLPVGVCVASLGGILLLLILVTFAKTAKIGKITPIRAIRGGVQDVYFKSRMMTAIYKRGLYFHLALRQLISGKKQYISAGIVTALLVFFLSLTARIGAWIGPDGTGLMQAFNTVTYDIGVKYTETQNRQETKDEIEKWMNKEAGVESSFLCVLENASIDHIDYLMNVNEEPERFRLLRGHTCKYDNEILVTETVAREIGKDIGDTVEVNYDGNSAEFMISGVYQCANDMGANFGISKDGAKRLGLTDESKFFTYYVLHDPDKVDVMMNELKDKYDDRISVDDPNSWSGLSSIVSALDAFCVLMYVISMLFIFVVIIMTGSKILYQEKNDFGIYKSLGFTSFKLRIMFALRFGIVSAIGGIAGIILSAGMTDPIVGVFLQRCGIAAFSSRLTPLAMIQPAIVVMGMFMVFAYFASRGIRKVEPRILITE